MSGYASSDDKLFRWALWRFWDTHLPYMNFIDLHPRSIQDPILEERIEGWMTTWEHGRDKSGWRIGGYVVTTLFPRVCWTAQVLRRLDKQGVDMVGERGVDASMVFARKACMIVMMPGIDEALTVRPDHQAFVLSALTGLGVPVGTVGPDGALQEWRG